MSGTTQPARPLAAIRFVPAHPGNVAEAMACALVNSGVIAGTRYTDYLHGEGFDPADVTRHLDEAVLMAFRLVAPECRRRPAQISAEVPALPPLVAAVQAALNGAGAFAEGAR